MCRYEHHQRLVVDVHEVRDLTEAALVAAAGRGPQQHQLVLVPSSSVPSSSSSVTSIVPITVVPTSSSTSLLSHSYTRTIALSQLPSSKTSSKSTFASKVCSTTIFTFWRLKEPCDVSKPKLAT